MKELHLRALEGIPLVEPGDDLASLILAALESTGETLRDGDLLVIAQKIVSKAENRYLDLDEITPGPKAIELAAEVDKDPRLVEAILSESVDVIRRRPGVLIVGHRLGLVMANAGIDQSNITHDRGERLLLLPEDPDRSARQLRDRLRERTGALVAILINDSHGRAWRLGTTGVAIGCAGFEPLNDMRGETDLFGRVLKVSIEANADQLASAASLLQGQGPESQPVVLIRGFEWNGEEGPATLLVRPREEDLFR